MGSQPRTSIRKIDWRADLDTVRTLFQGYRQWLADHQDPSPGSESRVRAGLLGYAQDYGTPRVWENTAIAIIGGVILYVAILAYLVYLYFPKHAVARTPSTLPPSIPPP